MYKFEEPPFDTKGKFSQTVEWYGKSAKEFFDSVDRKVVALEELEDLLPQPHKKYAPYIMEWLFLQKKAYPKYSGEWYFFKEKGEEKIKRIEEVRRELETMFKKARKKIQEQENGAEN